MKKKNQEKAPANSRGARTALTHIHAASPLCCDELEMKPPERLLQPGGERGISGNGSAHVSMMGVQKSPPLSTNHRGEWG